MTIPIRDRPWDEFPRRMREISHTWIPVPDGTRLAARIWLPVDAKTDPVPGIIEYLPYRKNDATSLRDSRNAPYFAGHGYAVVRVDLRGTGDSEGTITDEYTQQELDDGLACISWIAGQPWCTGRVGIMGISWGGFNGLQLAARRPPELHAVLTLCSTDDRYADDVHYYGGALLSDQQPSWATTMLADNARPPDPAVWGDSWLGEWLRRLDATPPFIEAWMRHQRRDAFWQHASVCEDPAAIRCPVFLVGGWADAYRDAIFRMLASLHVPRRGLIGPWAHLWPHFARPGPRIGFLSEALRWWDHWLKDVDTGVMDEPAVLSWMQEPVPPRASYGHRPGRWVADPSWPSPNIATCEARLGARGTLAVDVDRDSRSDPVDTGHAATATAPVVPVAPAVPVAEHSQALEVSSAQAHGTTGGRACSYATSFDLPIDQRHDDALALCFDSEPVRERLEVLGAPEAELDISADQPQALVAVRVCDVAPDGTSTLVTRGVFNLAHRDSHERPEPLEPHRRYRVRFGLHAIGYAIPAGHRVRVAVAPTCWPLVWPSPHPVTLAVRPGTSRVLLPVRRTLDSWDTAEFPYPEPEQAAFGHRPLDATAEVDRGTISRDLESGTVTVDYEGSGGFTVPEHDAELYYRPWERDVFEINDLHPCSARAVSQRRIDIARTHDTGEEWRTRVDANAELTADVENFHVTTRVSTYYGDDQVFDRAWTFTFPRDHV